MTALALLLSATVWGVAVLHASWGLGHHWPASSPGQLAKAAVGTRGITRMPPPSQCLAVAAILTGVASWPLFAVGLLAEGWPRWLTLLAGAGIAVVFLGRGVAGYTSSWRGRFPEQPFATYDRSYYSPLCLALGAGYLFIVIAGTNP